MKVANNMDSVFASAAQDEREFDVMFDDDDCLIDLVAGVKEDGSLVTGADPEYTCTLDENGDPLTDEDAEALRAADVKYAGDPAEGTKKDANEEFESPEGMKNEIPGSANSAESNANDTKDEEAAIKEEDDPITDKCDTGRREGEIKDDSDNVEGQKQEVIGAALEKEEVCEKCGKPMKECSCKESVEEALAIDLLEAGIFLDEEFDPSSETDDTFEKRVDSKEDPITDKEADDLRDGSEKYDSKNVEGEKQEVVGAAQESCEGCEGGECLDKEVSKSDGMNDVTVPDKVQVDGSANDIPKDAETQSSDGVEPATESYMYTGWRHVTEADDKVALSSDDADIEAVDNGDFESDSDLDLTADYDDDELIDLAISGGSLD